MERSLVLESGCDRDSTRSEGTAPAAQSRLSGTHPEGRRDPHQEQGLRGAHHGGGRQAVAHVHRHPVCPFRRQDSPAARGAGQSAVPRGSADARPGGQGRRGRASRSRTRSGNSCRSSRWSARATAGCSRRSWCTAPPTRCCAPRATGTRPSWRSWTSRSCSRYAGEIGHSDPEDAARVASRLAQAAQEEYVQRSLAGDCSPGRRAAGVAPAAPGGRHHRLSQEPAAGG